MRLTKIAAFDFIENFFEVDDFVNDILQLPVTEPVNESFEASGLQSLYFINNLSTFYAIIMFYFFLVVVWIVIYFIRKCKETKNIKKVDKKLRAKLFWNGLIIVVMESFMMVVFCAFITFNKSFEFGSFGLQVQNLTMITCLLVYILVPIVVLVGVIR